MRAAPILSTGNQGQGGVQVAGGVMGYGPQARNTNRPTSICPCGTMAVVGQPNSGKTSLFGDLFIRLDSLAQYLNFYEKIIFVSSRVFEDDGIWKILQERGKWHGRFVFLEQVDGEDFGTYFQPRPGQKRLNLGVFDDEGGNKSKLFRKPVLSLRYQLSFCALALCFRP